MCVCVCVCACVRACVRVCDVCKHVHTQVLYTCRLNHYYCSPLETSLSSGVWMVSTLTAKIEGSPRCYTSEKFFYFVK